MRFAQGSGRFSRGALPETRAIFARSGALEPYITSPEEFAAVIRADYEKYGKIVRAVGAKVD